MEAHSASLVVYVSDVSRCRAFYEIFGISFQSEPMIGEAEGCSARIGSFTLVLCRSWQRVVTVPLRLTFTVANIHQARGALAIAGISYWHAVSGTGIVCRDPDGRIIELMSA